MKKTKSLCIIDDDPIYTFGLKKIIEFGKFDVETIFYENGKEAYENLSQVISDGESLPDLILLDINMPIWNGWKFLDEFTKLLSEPSVVVYIISSSIDPKDREKATEYQIINSFIVKPVSIDKIREILQSN
ncbi:response regulator [Echinicola sp. CAU 1574]|uniref:Response regulator n=1 Tax=Echinicola arenosa TaxID=2774144 RepID=A0ABR9AQ47_9BACT|nr:response regulator [Echinicola arenosa]MBD8490916.1 response regulator [Echinicola arenosa]